MWTIERVKAELPPVMVKMPNGEITIGTVRGRRLDFPVVSAGIVNADFAWKTIVDALNNEKPLLV